MRTLKVTYPRSQVGSDIPAFELSNGKTLAITTSSARLALNTSTGLILVSVSIGTYLKFGDNTVTAATTNGNHDVYMPAGAIWYMVIPSGTTYLAGIGDNTGNLHVATAQ